MDATTQEILQQLYDYQQVSEAVATQTGASITWTAEEWANMSITEQYNAMTSLGYSALRNPETNMLGWYQVTGAEKQAFQEYTVGVKALEDIKGVSAVTQAKTVSGSGIAVKEIVKDETTGAVTAQAVGETTTASGAVINAGGSLNALKVANTVLLGAMIGGAIARDYKEHRSFWNDIGDAVMQQGEFTGINLGGTMPAVESDWNGIDAGIDVARVISRRVTDFYGISNYYTYMSEYDIACVLTQLAAEGVFNPNDISFDMETGHIEVQGDREHLVDFALHINNLHNKMISLSSGTIIPSLVMEQAIKGLMSYAPSDYSCLSMHLGGRPLYDVNANIYLFKPSNPCEVSANSGITQGTNSIYGVVGNIYHASIESYTGGTTEINYDIATNVPLYMGFTQSINPSVGNNGNTYAGNGNSVWVEGGLPEQGISPDITADMIDIGAGATLADVLNQMRTQYPDWYGEGFETSNYNPTTGLFDKEKWLPVSIPWTNPNETPYDMPDGYNQGYGQSGKPYPNPQTTPTGIGTPYPYPWTAPYLPSFPTTVFPDVPPSGYPTPKTPAVPPAVTGSSNALWAVYNPTFSEVSALGQYLWSSSIIDIIQKFFSNPMDSIISLHMIYTQPTTGASQNIKLGYLDSGVSAKTVSNQYKYIDCGTIDVPVHFQDVRDFSPYTKVEVYLPFIGIKTLAPEDIIGCKLQIKYSVDVLTGAILCELYITKQGVTQCLYTYAGNGSVQIPLTGGDRTRLLSGVISGVASIAGGALAGGAIAGSSVAGKIAGGAIAGGHSLNGLTHSFNVERSGSFSSNAGAMGIKKPYIIINRKEAYDAYDYPYMYGIPSNTNVQLGSCKGFTKIKSIHLNSIKATEIEKKELETLLYEGVVIN